jgi:hypothetical protein
MDTSSLHPTHQLHEELLTWSPGSLITLAYYYPWYIKDDWSRYGHAGTPNLSLYGMEDPLKIAEQHIEWATGAVVVFVVAWMGPNHLTSVHMETGLLQAKNLDKIHFCIHYKSLKQLGEFGLYDFRKPAILEKMIANFRHLKNTYFEHPSYFKLKDGLPVVPFSVT